MRRLIALAALIGIGILLYLFYKSGYEKRVSLIDVPGWGKIRRQADSQAAEKWRAYFDRLAEEGLNDD